MKDFNLKERQFGFLNPYIIAEIGVNHAGSMEKAKEMIKSVADNGGHAAKFQTYKAEKIATENYSPSYWDLNEEPSTSQYQLFKKFDSFGEKEYKELENYCKKCGIDFMSTPFDLDAVDMLDGMQDAFKIASADITNIPLLKKVAKINKPIIMSTGASTRSEIDYALEILKENGATNVSLLHCVLNYPTPQKNAQLQQIDNLIQNFGRDYTIGYSDHVKPNEDGTMPALEIAVLRGCTIIEKHFTYDKTLSGNDHYHAMDGNDLKEFTSRLKTYRLMWGQKEKDIQLESKAIQNARRRIIASADIKKGEKITEDKLITLRSNIGIESQHWEILLNKEASCDIPAMAPVKWGDFR
jgi:sialic acid synthase SpsE